MHIVPKIKSLLEKEATSSLVIMGLRVNMLGSKFLLSLFIARYMGLDILGVYGLIIAAGNITQSLLRCGVFHTLSRDAVHQSTKSITTNLLHYGNGILILYLLLIPPALVAGWYFDKLLLSILIIVIFISEHVVFDIFSLTNNLQYPKLANFILMIQSASWIYLFIIMAFFVESLRDLETLLLFWICGGLLAMALSLYSARNWPWKAAFKERIRLLWYKNNLKRSWRLYLNDIIWSSNTYLDRYLVKCFLTLEMVGVYVLFSQITGAIIYLISSGVMNIYRPKLIKSFKMKDMPKFWGDYKECVKRTLFSIVCLGVLAATIMPFLLKFTNKPMALDYIPLLWLMLFGLMFRGGYVLAQMGLFTCHLDKWLLISNILGLFIMLFFGSIFLFYFGIYGLIIAIMLSACAIMLFARLFLSKEVNKL